MNVFAKFDKIPSMILEVIKETKRYGHTFGRTVVRSVGQRENDDFYMKNCDIFLIFAKNID